MSSGIAPEISSPQRPNLTLTNLHILLLAPGMSSSLSYQQHSAFPRLPCILHKIRITEQFGLERTFKGHLVQVPRAKHVIAVKEKGIERTSRIWQINIFETKESATSKLLLLLLFDAEPIKTLQKLKFNLK